MDAVYSKDFADSKTEAMSMRHLATHKPKLRSCDTCRRAKAMQARRIRTSKQALKRVRKIQAVRPEKFGDRVTLDHIIARSERNMGYGEQQNAITLIDAATDFRWGKDQKYNSGEENLQVLQKVQGPDPTDKIKYVYSDAAPEIAYVVEKKGLGGCHDKSTPGDSQGNSAAENNNRDTKMGTAALITHAGVPLAYWPLALPCYCFGHNTTIMDGASPYLKRFGQNFDRAKMCPFGAEIKFIPSKIIGDAAVQFAGTTETGVFVGCGVNSGLVWSGDYLVSHIRQFATMNYHTGERKEGDEYIVIQIVRDVQRVDPSVDSPFAFPLEKHHEAAFDVPEGWRDSYWREPPPPEVIPQAKNIQDDDAVLDDPLPLPPPIPPIEMGAAWGESTPAVVDPTDSDSSPSDHRLRRSKQPTTRIWRASLLLLHRRSSGI
jgi:hypothetical protein